MLNELIKVMQDYASEYNTTTENFQKEQAYVKENYAGERLGEKTVELNGTYNEKISALRVNTKSSVLEIITKQKEATKNEINTPIPDDFKAKMDIYRNVSLDKAELQVIAEQYGNDYFSAKEIKLLAEKNNIPCKFTSVTEKVAELDALYVRARDVIDNYKGKNNSYMHEVFLTGGDIRTVEEYISKTIEIL